MEWKKSFIPPNQIFIKQFLKTVKLKLLLTVFFYFILHIILDINLKNLNILSFLSFFVEILKLIIYNNVII